MCQIKYLILLIPQIIMLFYGLFMVYLLLKKYLFISECFSNKKIKQW